MSETPDPQDTDLDWDTEQFGPMADYATDDTATELEEGTD